MISGVIFFDSQMCSRNYESINQVKYKKLCQGSKNQSKKINPPVLAGSSKGTVAFIQQNSFTLSLKLPSPRRRRSRFLQLLEFPPVQLTARSSFQL